MAAEEENDEMELEESITKEKTTKKKKTSTSKPQDDLMDFLASIKGISEVMKKRLHKVLGTQGITDPRGIKAHTLKQLMELPGVSENTAKLLLEEVESNQGKLFLSLDEREQIEVKRKKIMTGSSELDELIGGGIPTGTFVELYGSPQSGKTQICYTISANCMLPTEFGGLEAGVIWLDTEGSFNTQRFKQIISYYEYTHNIKNVKTDRFMVANTRTLSQIELALKEAGTIIPKNNVKLMIIDSLMDPFRAEYGGLGELAVRQKHLNKLLHMLMRLAEAFDIAVVYTNQVMANPDPFATAMDKVMPTGGFILGHASDIRIWLRRATSKIRNENDAPNARRALITDCGWLPQNECYFSLGPFGVCNVDQEANHRKLAGELGVLFEGVSEEKETEAKTEFATLD